MSTTMIVDKVKASPDYAKSLDEKMSNFLDRPVKWTTRIFDLGEEGTELTAPIPVLIEEYPDGSVNAWFSEIEVFGAGHSELEALYDLKQSILDLYDDLRESDSSELGKLPQMWLRILKSLIRQE